VTGDSARQDRSLFQNGNGGHDFNDADALNSEKNEADMPEYDPP
jgi:hypothetical protein